MTQTTPPTLATAGSDLEPQPVGVPPAKAARRALTSRGATIAVIAITLLWTIPTFGLFVNSFRGKADANTTGWWSWFAHPNVTLSNYHDVLFNSGGTILPLVNSVAITIPATIIPIFLASMAAYILAWVRFKGSDFIFFGIFALQVVPIQMALVPLQNFWHHGANLTIAGTTYQIIPSLGVGSLEQIWLTHTMFSMPLAVFLLHNFIAQLPDSLIEAARVDGASYLRIFRTVVLPLTTPAIASFAIFQFLWVWNDLLVAKTFGGTDASTQPVTARIQSLAGNFGAHNELLGPAGFIAIIIPLIVFLSLQRYFVRGLLAGSVKG